MSETTDTTERTMTTYILHIMECRYLAAQRQDWSAFDDYTRTLRELQQESVNVVAAELDAIADKLATLFTVRLDDPINTWPPETRDAWQKENLSRTIDRIRAVAQSLKD